MCGICGFITKQNISQDDLIRMNDTMTHRGPDDAGVRIYPAAGGYAVGLAQRRLAIRDLSPLGHQPMETADGRLSLVFNGEIYNMAALREELADYPFRSRCDTEVILAAYLTWGEEFLEHLFGMFALALYDRRMGVVLLARDRAGKKPLYYWQSGGQVVFASTLSPIMTCPGFPREINRRVLPRYLFQQYIHAPESIFQDVWQLCPGEMLRLELSAYGRGPKTEKRKYWDTAARYAACSADPVSDYEEAKTQLKELLKQAVADRMIADVPLGLFLSGGFDSSLMTALAQECSAEPVQTFSVGFREQEFDESAAAEAVARHLGTRHQTRIITEEDMFSLVDALPQYFDEPFADPSQIPTMLVSETARRAVTVALSGDGGDEMFCGYNIYDNVAQAQKLDVPAALTHLIGHIPIPGGGSLSEKYPFRVRVLSDNRDPLTKTQIASTGYIEAATAFLAGASDSERRRLLLSEMLPIKYPLEDRYPAKDWQVIRMLLDMDTYLPSDILCKVDRASMKYSLEARCPILDTRVVEYSFRIPHAFKYRNGVKKAILRDIAYDYIPRELLDRPKQGFGAPVDKWLRGPLQKELLEVSSMRYLTKQGIFEPEYVSKFVTDYLLKGDAGPATGRNFSKLVWSFYVFQKWERRWCRAAG
ncbi:MAG: asparagine synthase (glutamine-hydrolyzing) [Lachnospiraceae bacterium]|nr:asparagine synthase (glutamine-hydrolyzing) [Lachnospiraceae bacterium]